VHLDLDALKVEARGKRQPRKTNARPSPRCGTPLRSMSGGLVVLWGCPGMSGGIHSNLMYTRRAWLNASRHVAMQWRRFGYRRVYDMRQGEFPGTNQKKVFRLCRAQAQHGQEVPWRAHTAGGRDMGHQIRSLDFVSGSLSNSRRINCLIIADDFSHECVAIAVDSSMPGGTYASTILERAVGFQRLLTGHQVGQRVSVHL